MDGSWGRYGFAAAALTAYNSGIHEGIRALMIVGYLTVPTPAAVIITVLVKRDKWAATN